MKKIWWLHFIKISWKNEKKKIKAYPWPCFEETCGNLCLFRDQFPMKTLCLGFMSMDDQQTMYKLETSNFPEQISSGLYDRYFEIITSVWIQFLDYQSFCIVKYLAEVEELFRNSFTSACQSLVLCYHLSLIIMNSVPFGPVRFF